MWIFLALISASITLGSLYSIDTTTDSTLSQNTNETTISSDNIITTEDNLQNTSIETPETESETGSNSATNNISKPLNPIVEQWAEYIPKPETPEPIVETPVLKTDLTIKENISPLASIQIPRMQTPNQFDLNNVVVAEIETLDLRTPSSSDKRATKNNKPGKSPNYKGHLEVGLAFTPSISSKIVSENSALAGLINKEYYNFVGNNEAASFSNSYGINLQYHAPKNFFIASGLFVSQRTESVDYDYIVSDDP